MATGSRSGFAGPAAFPGCFFGSSGLRVFGSSGLRVFGSSGLRVFGSSGLRVFGLMAAASLALAACGGGDSTVQTQQPKPTAPVGPVVPPVKPDPEPVVPMPFAGLGSFEKGYAVGAIRKANFGIIEAPLQLRGRDEANVWTDSAALQITAWKDRPLEVSVSPNSQVTNSTGDWTKIVRVTPSGTTEAINYKIEFYLSGTVGGNSMFNILFEDDLFYPVSVNSDLDADDSSPVRFLTIQGDNWTSSKKIDLGFDESYNYNVMKNYQVMTANFDINKDKTSNASSKSQNVLDLGGKKSFQHLLKPQKGTMYSEIWTDYSGDNTNDYMVGGVWLLVPTELHDTHAYDFGGFVRGENPIARRKLNAVIGKATYKGSVAGLHTSWDNNIVKISRLLGKVTLMADFDNETNWGSVDGKVHDLKLDDKSIGGQLFLTSSTMNNEDDLRYFAEKVGIGNIQGINYEGSWGVVFQIPGETDADLPGGVVGTIGGTGSNGNTVVATFGAYKVEEE